MENKQELIVMCGLPGSGKSFFVDKYVENHSDHKVVSTDDIREELFGNRSSQENNYLVFITAFQRLFAIINCGESAIFDATNIRKKDRKKIIKLFKNKGVWLKVVCMITPVEVCKGMNLIREMSVPNEVIDKMNDNFTIPTKDEGWDEIVFSEAMLS